MKNILALLLSLLLCLSSFGQSFKKKYKGNIGPYVINVTMICNGGNITGTYYYEEFDDPISIRGFITGKSVEFKGYDLKGNQLDQFIGQLAQHDIHGIWIGEEGQKRQSFTLKEDPSTYSNGEEPKAVAFDWKMIAQIGGGVVVLLGIFIFIRGKKTKSKTKSFGFKSATSLQEKGYEFEKYMTAKLNPENYRLLEWHSDKIESKKFSITNTAPDLVFERKNTQHSNKFFSIECQYTNKKQSDNIDLGKNWSPVKFLDYSKKTNKPVFVAIGLGGLPSDPESVYVIPISKINNEIINLNDVSVFKITGQQQLNYDPEKNTLS